MISLDISNMMADVIGKNGLSKSDIDGLSEIALKAHETIEKRAHPNLAFMDLLNQDTSGIKAAAEFARGKKDFLLLGIGGSALGPKAIMEALSPFHNLRKSPRIFIYDNVDPSTLDAILGMINPKDTVVNVITKSGSTAETMASFMIIYERMKSNPENIIATTDPEKGFLRKLSRELGFKTLPVPPDVGGRYSVLCPVGLLPAAVTGANPDELLKGASDMKKRTSAPDLWKNPAYMFGGLLYLMSQRGRNINVLIPYSDRLRVLSEWFCQLWAESLGKDGLGSTPYPSAGTTDQHSQLQLWMEGPHDKTVAFIKVSDYGADVKIPDAFPDSGLSYLAGHGMSELIKAEAESTEIALAKAGRPNMAVEADKVDAKTLGGLFYMFEIATAFTGFMTGVNPFDQPSVEESKNYTYAMMGRDGFAAKKAEVEETRKRRTGWRV